MLSCPRCTAPEVRRSRWRWADLPPSLVGLRAHRCLECYWRFLAMWWRRPASPARAADRPRSKRRA